MTTVQQTPVASSTDALMEAMKLLQAKVPINSYGLPEGIYRPDFLPRTTLPSSQVGDNGTTDNGRMESSPETASKENASDASLLTNGEHHTNGATDPDDVVSLSLPTVGNVALEDRLRELGFESSPHLLEVAYLPLSYAEGFPTLGGGTPLWTKLDFEPMLAFKYFEVYLRQVKCGARQLFLLQKEVQENPAVHHSQKVSTSQLQNWFILYHWNARAKAFDLFNEALQKRLQNQRAWDTQDFHFLTAQRLTQRALSFLDSQEAVETLTSKAAIDLLKLATQLQRVSAGLPAAGPPGVSKDGGPGQSNSLEVILRQIAHRDHGGDPTAETLATVNEDDVVLEQALSSPETAALAQELIIRLNTEQAGDD